MDDWAKGDLIENEFKNKLKALSEIGLVSEKEIGEKKKYDINIRKNLLLLNEESFKSFEAQLLWNNKKPVSVSYKII